MDMEGMREGSYEKAKEEGLMAEDFHLDPSKEIDPVDTLVEKLGPNGAFDELAGQLPPDTNPEIVRQLKLILNKALKQNLH